MATKRWIGSAAPVAQVDTLTIGGTLEVGDLLIVTIGSKTFSHAATSATLATAATAFAAAWNALSATEYPEFAEITAAATSGGALTLTADTPGKPFTVAVSTTEANGGAADDQTFGRSATRANSGPNVVSVAANWEGGVAPVDGDDLVFDSGSVSVLYDLDQNGITPATITVLEGYTGLIGLPNTNADGGSSQSYNEYRPKYLMMGDAGDAQAVTVTIRGGGGRIKIDTGDAQTVLIVQDAGQAEEDRIPAVLWKGTHASNTATIQRGSVGIGFFAGESATVATLAVGYLENVAGDATVNCGTGCTLTTVNQSGGNLTTQSAVTTANVTDGEWTHMAGAVTTINLDGGACRYRSTGTLTTVNVGSDGELDFSRDMRARTVTNCNLHERSIYRDPVGTVTLTNGVDFIRCTPADVTFVVIPHRTWTPSAI